MREIKFRAWDYNNECIIPWVKIRLEKEEDENTFSVVVFDGAVGDHYDDFPYMQYTGLKDKNGKEIFEGDIVQQNYKDMYNQSQAFAGEVVYSDCVYWLKNGGEYTFLYDEYRIYESVVIGNIYENPELLGDSQ